MNVLKIAVLSRPGVPLERMTGILKVLRRTVPLFAVPTTAGTGSEATAAAVVSDPASHRKFAISDPCLIPDGAAFDPRLLTRLPAKITAETGLDALCHAVEAYVGRSNTRETRRLAESAAHTIFATLEFSALNPEDLAARAAMQRAAFEVGRAFTRAYIGYAHAIAHALGGGTACRTVLPAPFRCLRFSKATGAPRGGRSNGLPKARGFPPRPTASLPNCTRSTSGSASPLLFRAYGRKTSRAFRRPRSAKRTLHIRFPVYSTSRT